MDIKKILEEKEAVKPTQKQEDVAGKVIGLFNQFIFDKNLPVYSELTRRECWKEDLGEDFPEICVAMDHEKYYCLESYIFPKDEKKIAEDLENAPLYISLQSEPLNIDEEFAYEDMLTEYKPALEEACDRLAELYEGE